MNTRLMLAGLAAPLMAQAAPQTVQQAFDAANARVAAGDHAGAVDAWRALEKRVAGNPRSRAIVRVRLSSSLVMLGRIDEAAAAARAGLAELPTDDASLKNDRYDAYMALGQADRLAFDYPSARANYHQAAMLSDAPTEKLSAQLGELRVATFVDPDAALAIVPQVEAILAAGRADPTTIGVVKASISELYLNLGRFDEARAAAAAAVKANGGLTLKTSLEDVSARSDFALAALKLGRDDEARQYLAYTGAGRAQKGNFNAGVELVPPDCGGDAGIRPDDVAVIEFSVGEDGAVIGSRPIYASRKGGIAVAFARAARDWSWTPEQLKDLPGFFRNRVRLEMRCSTTFARPGIGDYLNGELGTWLASKGAPLNEDAEGSDAARLQRERAAAAAAPAGGLAAVPRLFEVATNRVTPQSEASAAAARALPIAAGEGAPPVARLALERITWADAISDRNGASKYRAALTAAMSRPPYASDPEARAALSLMLVDALGRRESAAARAALARVAGEQALPRAHPLRVGAQVRLASIEQASGRTDAASAAFAATGLDARQCALLDAQPKLRSASGNFPMEAMRWGFEGWTRVQYDIAADGSVTNERVIASYPPFVFTQAGAQTLEAARYTPSYRPDGALGCGGAVKNVMFKLPG